MTSLIDKLRQIADAKVGGPMPECMKGPIPEAALCSIAQEAVMALEGRVPIDRPLMPGDIEQLARWKALPLLKRLEAFACECVDSNLSVSAADLREAVVALEAAEVEFKRYHPWQPIETAPVPPFDRNDAWRKFRCLLQLEKGYVCEGWAYWLAPRRTSQLPILRWANYQGQCQPVAWMPLPEASLEHARSKP